MDIFLLYIWTRLDTIIAIAWVVVLILSAIGLIGVISWMVNADMMKLFPNDSKYLQAVQSAKTTTNKVLRAMIIPLIIVTTLPSQEDTAVIAGGWAVKQVTMSDEARKISAKTLAIINGRLDVELKELEAVTEQEKKTSKAEEIYNRTENLDKAIADGTILEELAEIERLAKE